jgi:hypothetical protein
MFVAKPWIDVEPAPLTSHSLGGLPGFVFSHATGFVTGASQGAAAAGEAEMTSSAPVTAAIATEDRQQDASNLTARRYARWSGAAPPVRPVRAAREGFPPARLTLVRGGT